MRVRNVSDSVLVDASPQAVYDVIADPSGYGRFSPEATGGVVDGALDVGAEFDGTNRRGPMRWATRCVVTDADPGRRFAFRVEAIGSPHRKLRVSMASWAYELEEVAGKTRVTETWTDERPWPNPVAAVIDPLVTGKSTFAKFQQENIRSTLAKLQSLLG